MQEMQQRESQEPSQMDTIQQNDLDGDCLIVDSVNLQLQEEVLKAYHQQRESNQSCSSSFKREKWVKQAEQSTNKTDLINQHYKQQNWIIFEVHLNIGDDMNVKLKKKLICI